VIPEVEQDPGGPGQPNRIIDVEPYRLDQVLRSIIGLHGSEECAKEEVQLGICRKPFRGSLEERRPFLVLDLFRRQVD
jgi:hypothetical protein